MSAEIKQELNCRKAIAVIDSGVGGLTVVKEISRRLPGESIIYFGDTARMPYGPRSHEEVRGFVFEIIEFLSHQEIKMLVVACNSATAAGLEHYRKKVDLPVIGVIEPGVRAALKESKNKTIGVIGTSGTINSGEYEKALQSQQAGLYVTGKACPLFVLMVENNLLDTPEARQVTYFYLDSLVQEGIDTLILGCTHYPLMAGLIQDVVGPAVRLVNSAEEVARDVEAVLESSNMINPSSDKTLRHRFFVSGHTAPFEEVGSKLLERSVKAYQVIL